MAVPPKRRSGRRKTRRQSHGTAWHWKQTDCWCYTLPGCKKRVPLFDEEGNRIRRNGIEDGLGTNVNFFHLDNLSSEVRLNVDLDVTLTVIANSCYRWLAQTLRARQAQAVVAQVHRDQRRNRGPAAPHPPSPLDRRCHNPILREAALDKAGRPIPWLKGYRIEFDYR